MAGPIKLTEVDFEQIKENLINYLRSTKQFTDYDFAGSNLQVILNLISYQAQLNAYTTNMLANESFLSSSSLRTNVVENANLIGYTPTSARSAKSIVDLEFRLTQEEYPHGFPTYLVIKKGMVLSAGNANDTFTFNLKDDSISGVIDASGIVRFQELESYEGIMVEEKFVFDEAKSNQRFVLMNELIDTTTLGVSVQEVGSETNSKEYNEAKNLVKVTSESRVYWIEETRDGLYEIKFGDGYFGRKLRSGAVIRCKYIVSSGELANGIQQKSQYSYTGSTEDSFGSKVSNRPLILSSRMESTGAFQEDIGSIKLRAPRNYESQNRCVTADDYDGIIRQIFPAVDDIYVYGGEILDEPQFGRIYIAIKPTTGDRIPSITKNYIKKSLEPYRVASLDLNFVDPDIVNVEIESTVHYDDRKTSKDSTGIIASVKDSLSRYKDASTVSKFGGVVRYSNIISIIDDSDSSINRNNTNFRLRKDIEPIINTYATYEICFSNPLFRDFENPVIKSTGFRMEVNGIYDERVYYLEDDTKGNIRSYYVTENNRKVIFNNYFGTCNYDTGDIQIGYGEPIKIINVTEETELISFRCKPKNQDVIAKESVFLNLDIGSSDIIAFPDLNSPR